MFEAFHARHFRKRVAHWYEALFAWKGPLRYFRARYFRYLGYLVILTPLVMGLASFFLLVNVPQMREVYLSIIDKKDILQGLGGLAVLGLFSALLYSWNQILVTRRIDAIYPRHADLRFDHRVMDVRDFMTMLIASLPFLGLLGGLWQLRQQIKRAKPEITEIATALHSGLPKEEDLITEFSFLDQRILWNFVIILAVYITILITLHVSRHRRQLHWWLIYLCYGIAAVLILVPVFFPSVTLTVSRIVGPLTGSALVLIGGAILLRLLFWTLQYLIWLILTIPSAAITLLPSALFGFRQFFYLLTYASFIALLIWSSIDVFDHAQPPPRSSFSALKEQRESEDGRRRLLTSDFAAWLKQRKTASGPFDVFIVTAEGGGIYATSAASFFLATIQERCPQFARHVFAISSVSGGSIGASLFDAEVARSDKSTAAGCDFQRKDGILDHLAKVTLDDHFTPVMAYLLPDLIHDFIRLIHDPWPVAWTGRNRILENSFVRSFEDHAGSANTAESLQADGEGDFLRETYAKTWCPGSDAPALLLNATWVETGFRVAFSPFPLQQLGRGTLYSFDDIANIAEHEDSAKSGGQTPNSSQRTVEDWVKDVPQCSESRAFGVIRASRPGGKPLDGPSLIEASVVSALFPVIMPPWLYNNNRWTFVDGGYADSSGATTGLELYKALDDALKNDGELKTLAGDGVKLHLVVLTDALTEPDLKEIKGSWYDDFISPLDTLLTVRQLLARRAVTEAYSQLGPELIWVQLDQRTFPLPLGWKISETSSNLIRFMMGSPEPGRCMHLPKEAESKLEHDKWAVWAVNHNSCALESITQLLASEH